MNKSKLLLEKLDKLNCYYDSDVDEKKFDKEKIINMERDKRRAFIRKIADDAAKMLIKKNPTGGGDFVLLTDNKGKFIISDKSIAGHDVIRLSPTQGSRTFGLTVKQISQAIFDQMWVTHVPTETIGF